ncbi:MAG TPA: hypothetical protein PKH07_06220, partial [bacterium]|nr:hypothetical protein [bacterium]
MRNALVILVLLGACLVSPVQGEAALELLGQTYRSDVDFPQHWPFWGTPRALGGTAHVFVRNIGSDRITIGDVFLEGISLKSAIALSSQKKKGFLYASSIHFSTLNAADMQKLMNAGEPIWWKSTPPKLEPGTTAEVIIRLRSVPRVQTFRVGVYTDTQTLNADIPVVPIHPRIESISFSAARDKVYLYFKHPEGAAQELRHVFMDGRNVTAQTQIAYDPNVSIVPAVLALAEPLVEGSFHCYWGEYADSTRASAGLRTYSGEMWYGLCGARPGSETDFDLARRYLRDIHDHRINVQMPTLASSAVQSFLKTEEGQDLCEELGIRLMPNVPGKWNTRDPVAFYLVDEPDVGEYSLVNLEEHQKAGTLAQNLFTYSEPFRETDPETPHLVNLDMTLKPFNWYVYGLVPDVFCADPYYQNRLTTAYWSKPAEISRYQKATYITAVGELCQSACAPNPLFLLLQSTV